MSAREAWRVGSFLLPTPSSSLIACCRRCHPYQSSGAHERILGDTMDAQKVIDLPDQGATSSPAPITDWTDKDDPGNPRNFSLKRRAISTAVVTLLAFVTTISGSIYAPSHDQVSAEFHVAVEVAILPLSLFAVGMAFGPLVGAPLSETYGRKIVFVTTSPIFALFILGSGLSRSATALCACRFFAGVFASPAISNASATIIDYTAGRYRAISLSFYYSIPFMGAVFGPLLGGFLVESRGWRWTQWTTLFFIITFYIPVLFTRETYKKTVLQQRAKQLGVPGPPQPDRTLRQWTKYFLTTLVFRPVHMLVTEPIVTLVCVYNGFMFGLMYTFIIASPWIFDHYYGFNQAEQALSFLGLIAGTLIAPMPLILMDLRIYQPRLKAFRANNPDDVLFPPENRLHPAMVFGPVLPTALLIFAWTARSSIHWIVPIVFQSLGMLASVVIYSSANLFMLDSYGPLYGASAAGAAMLTRYTLSAAFPLFALQMYRGLGVGWATTLLALCTAAMAPIPWLFWRYGKTLRDKGKYETVS